MPPFHERCSPVANCSVRNPDIVGIEFILTDGGKCKMTRLWAKVSLICVFGLLVPPIFMFFECL